MMRICFFSLLSALLLYGSNGALAQEVEQETKIACSSVPTPARDAFKKMFPKAVIKGCATELENGKTAYEFTSVERRIGRDVLFYEDGSLIVVEETIDFDKIPQPVREAVQKVYPRRTIKLSEKATRGQTVYYEFHIRSRGKDVQLVFDPNGKEIKL
ncbi:MAG TPA: PepSY-like domain-containing protein [Hyphomicrobiaceae bacterium]|jgi:uncharacterized membrane protein YkoI|nr:PepSY-like domain-containing protein [Hyphomicrobiaceae bacterium]